MKFRVPANPTAVNGFALILLILISLTGCDALAQSTPQALPTVVLGSNNSTQGNNNTTPQTASSGASPAKAGSVTASGVIAPAQDAQLAFSLGETVKTLQVAVGDHVKAGQVLAELDDAALQAQVAQAKAAVDTAQANYNLLAAGPTAEQVRQAEAALLVATATYSRTVEGPRQPDIDAAQAALTTAQNNYAKVRAGPQSADVALAQANLSSAEAAVRKAQADYDRAYAANPATIGANPAGVALEKATNDYNAARAAYDKASQGPDQAQLAAAFEQVVSAQAALERAKSPVSDAAITQARAQVVQAQAQLDAARAGTRAQQLEVAKFQVVSAQAQVRTIEIQLAKLVLKAPFDGTVTRVNVQSGVPVMPGQVILTLVDVGHLHVDTTDLSERDVPQVQIGQPVTVLIKALNQTATGHVSAISSLADTLGGDVVYKTRIDLDTVPAGLRAGMSVEVQFGAGK